MRELENVIERAIILSDRHEISGQGPALRSKRTRAAAPATTTEDKKIPAMGILPLPGLNAGDRLSDSGLKVRQMRAMEFIKTHGFITNKYYSQLAEISERQALRELSELVDTGRLLRTGKGRACRYVLNGPAGI